jgi:hypothetical protein
MSLRINYVLIDYESVQPEALSVLHEEHFRLIVFVGATQAKVSFETAAALQRMGNRAEYIKIAGTGPNALDFHIAFYIGHALHRQRGSAGRQQPGGEPDPADRARAAELAFRRELASGQAGKRAAAVMSLIQSAKLNGLDPYAYLRDVLERLPLQPASRISELLPHEWTQRRS